ncbi:MAG: NAD(P)/FAD-dependent oxidoreductase [Solirubrobacteraceae bacterium]|nr:NAD(P)/FAD-dependent oxidoreductase [Solirubrobacteraceae bacterium]
MPRSQHRSRSPRSIAVVGGGFGGLAAAIMLRQAGYRDVVVFERAERIGGVWHQNTYPGAACDVASHLYEFSFSPNPRWSRRFAPQAEIQQYMERVADEYDVASRFRLGVEVERATWDQSRSRWRLQTSAGEHEADILLTACGQLTHPKIPDIPGYETFAGPAFHTSQWDHGVDVRGKRVAVIGTGASAIQVVPALQPHTTRLDVYQRSPGWTLPKMDHAYAPSVQRLFERVPALQRLDRWAQATFMDIGAVAMTRHHWMLAPFRAAGRRQINRAITDLVLREKVTPTDEFGCKRLMLTDHWYPTLAKPDVELIDDAITEFTAEGVRTSDGTLRESDVVIWATGFCAHEFVAPMAIIGAGGSVLGDAWADGARAYLGLTMPQFPNLFLLYGPNTNGGTGSVIETIECGMRHVLAALAALEQSGAAQIELTEHAAVAFDRELRAALAGTVWHTGCRSWYVDERGHDANQWPWTWREYARRTAALEPGAYRLSGAAS